MKHLCENIFNILSFVEWPTDQKKKRIVCCMFIGKENLHQKFRNDYAKFKIDRTIHYTTLGVKSILGKSISNKTKSRGNYYNEWIESYLYVCK